MRIGSQGYLLPNLKAAQYRRADINHDFQIFRIHYPGDGARLHNIAAP